MVTLNSDFDSSLIIDHQYRFKTKQATREFEYERLTAVQKDEMVAKAEEERFINTVWVYIIIFFSISLCICVGCICESIWKCI